MFATLSKKTETMRTKNIGTNIKTNYCRKIINGSKVKYYAKENSSIGTHSFYAVPIPNGTLTFDELLDEAMDGS